MASSLSLSSTYLPRSILADWSLDSRPLRSTLFKAIKNARGRPGGLLPDLINLVASYLQEEDKQGRIFGKKEWETRFNCKVSKAPDFPPGLEEVWQNARSPVNPQEKLKDTHMLFYFPDTVDEVPLNLRKFGEIVKGHLSPSLQKILDGSLTDSSDRMPSHWMIIMDEDHLKDKDVEPTSFLFEPNSYFELTPRARINDRTYFTRMDTVLWTLNQSVGRIGSYIYPRIFDVALYAYAKFSVTQRRLFENKMVVCQQLPSVPARVCDEIFSPLVGLSVETPAEGNPSYPLGIVPLIRLIKP